MLQIGARRHGCVGASCIARLTNHKWFGTVKKFARMMSPPCSDWILCHRAMGEHNVKYVCVAKTKCAFASISRRLLLTFSFIHSGCNLSRRSPTPSFFFLFLPPTHPPSLHLPLIISLHLSPLHSLDERNGGMEELKRERERRIQP